MTIKYIKKAEKTPSSDEIEIRKRVQEMIQQIEQRREEGVKEISKKFDKYEGEIILPQDKIEDVIKSIDQKIKDDVQFSYDRVRKFAEHQLKHFNNNFEVELSPGLFAGQKLIPVDTVGCYIPGGLKNYIASAIMSITTAKVAGVKTVIAASPPKDQDGANPIIIYTANLCGANIIMNLGGVAAIGAFAYGCFGNPEVDMIVGPGNQYVAEAKRLLYGKVGIDLIAGPTEIAIIADKTADKEIVASDLVGQAEHGPNSPAWLFTNDQALCDFVLKRVPELIADLPEHSKNNAGAAWRDYGEIILCNSTEELCRVSDQYAPEHLEVQAENLNWWKDTLRNYGSLFLGEETTVTYGDKCSGPNHILPTKGAAKYTGGLSVGKFIKTVTFQRMNKESNKEIGAVAARISRLEGMEAHARTGDIRLRKYGHQN